MQPFKSMIHAKKDSAASEGVPQVDVEANFPVGSPKYRFWEHRSGMVRIGFNKKHFLRYRRFAAKKALFW